MPLPLNVRLTGTKATRSAIGARVTVVAGAHVMIDKGMSDDSHYSQNWFALHLRSPRGEVQRWVEVPSFQTVRITAGAAK